MSLEDDLRVSVETNAERVREAEAECMRLRDDNAKLRKRNQELRACLERIHTGALRWAANVDAEITGVIPSLSILTRTPDGPGDVA